MSLDKQRMGYDVIKAEVFLQSVLQKQPAVSLQIETRESPTLIMASQVGIFYISKSFLKSLKSFKPARSSI